MKTAVSLPLILLPTWTPTLADYAGVVVCVSGGKDSQAILERVCEQAAREGVLDRVVAVHARTGAGWPQSEPHCAYLCEQYGIPLHVVLPLRPLPESIRRRGMWPSASCRYCTSDHKRDPIAKFIRRRWPARGKEDLRVLVVSGERREESPHRARLPEFAADRRLTAGRREVLHWWPILDLSTEEVFAEIRATGFPHHVAYDLGSTRVSCALCVLASENDLRVGAKHNPDLARLYLRLEEEMGHTFRPGRSLAEILGDIEGA